MSNREESFVFGKKNYIAISVGFFLVLLGFMLMSGGKSDDPNIFNGDEVFSSTRITLAPFTVLLGFVTVGIGIMLKPDNSKDENNSIISRD
tara:strand:+ start:418 stop:690 length:273 start_codon:yes stop_codon:yes gene_type:complete